MARKHPALETLQKFMEGRLQAAETREVVRHLLTGCARCKRVTSRLHGGAKEQGEFSIQRVVAGLRSIEVDVEREEAAAPQVLATLMRHPPTRRELLIRNSKSYQTLALCRLVLKAALKAGFRAPHEAVELAEVGLTVATQLDGNHYGGGAVHDLQAKAWATLGNARRIISDFRGAEKAFQAAESALAAGSHDPLDKARMAVLRAQLVADCGAYETAFSLFDRAIAIYRRLGETHRQGCALIEKGHRLRQSGDPAGAIELLRHGLALVHPTREPRRVLTAKHNLVLAYHQCGRFREASQLLDGVRALHQVLGNPIDLLRFRWLEGRIAQGQGELNGAERAFKAAQSGFIAHEIPFDAALVSLDLAEVYLEQGLWAEIQDLASEMVAIFRSLNVHREALAAVALFQQAAEQERVSLAWLSSLAGYLEKAQSNSALRFRPT